jgi:YVTN family beta-propeller protein
VKHLVLAAVIAVAANCPVVAEAGDAQIQLKQTIRLAGVEGRIDHFGFDATGERLFVCALGNNSVEVLDLRTGDRIHSITGLGSPQGIAYIPELNRLFIANDERGIVKIVDANSFQSVGELDFKDDADNQKALCRVWQRRHRSC